MVVACSKRRTVWEKADGEDRGRSFKINLCRRGSATIAACSGRRHRRSPESNITNQTTGAQKSIENYRKSVKNRPKIVTKSLLDGSSDQNRPWTVFGTILWTPKMGLGRSKSALRMPLGLPKAHGERLWAHQIRAKTRPQSPRAALGAHLPQRAPPKTPMDRFSKVFAAKFQCFFGLLVHRFSIVFAIVFR